MNTTHVNLVSTREAAERLGISPRTLWGITAPRGDLNAVKIGRAVRYCIDDIERFIAAHRTGAMGSNHAEF